MATEKSNTIIKIIILAAIALAVYYLYTSSKSKKNTTQSSEENTSSGTSLNGDVVRASNGIALMTYEIGAMHGLSPEQVDEANAELAAITRSGMPTVTTRR